MNYLLATRNAVFSDAPQPQGGFAPGDWNALYRGRPGQVKAGGHVRLSNKQPVDFVDFLFLPVPLVSARVKRSIDLLEPGMAYREFVFATPDNTAHARYYLPLPHQVQVEQYNRESGAVVLEQGQALEGSINYGVQGKQILPILRLDLVEHILRGGSYGFGLRNIQLVWR